MKARSRCRRVQDKLRSKWSYFKSLCVAINEKIIPIRHNYNQVLASEYCKVVFRYALGNSKLSDDFSDGDAFASVKEILQNVSCLPLKSLFRGLLWIGLQRRVLPLKFRYSCLQFRYFFTHGHFLKIETVYSLAPKLRSEDGFSHKMAELSKE